MGVQRNGSYPRLSDQGRIPGGGAKLRGRGSKVRGGGKEMEAFPAEVRARGGWEGGVSVTSGIWKERWGQARLLGLDAAVRERGVTV